MFFMKIFVMYYQLNKGNSVFLLHTQLHEPIQNFHLSSNHVHMLKTKGLLWSYKKDFSQTFPHIHIMYLKSVHAHSLAIFLACQLFLSHNTFHCPSVHIKLKAILFILNQNQHDYIISSESAFFQQNNAPAIKPERYILSISNYLKLFLCHRLFLYNLSVSKISFFES